MREIKFRAWIEEKKEMRYFDFLYTVQTENFAKDKDWSVDRLMQYTGLKDKNGLQEVYEGDIIDSNGNIKGNIYEMDKGEADFVIEGLGTSAWSETEKGGLERGLKYAQ